MLVKITKIQEKKTNKIRYSVNSVKEELIESWNKSKTIDGVWLSAVLNQ
jgi:hypothetical protein